MYYMIEDYNYRVLMFNEDWSKADDPPLAVAMNASIAIAAYDAAIVSTPNRNIMLCNRARIMSRHNSMRRHQIDALSFTPKSQSG